MIIGTFPPIGPIENNCTKVTTPAISIAFCKSETWIAANTSASCVAAQAPVIISTGVKLPTNIARTCCKPKIIACFKEIFPSKS